MQSNTTFGIAVHGVPEREGSAENLAKGDTYIVVESAASAVTRHVRSAGSGAPDRRRAAMSTFGVLRDQLLAR